jgi:predicted metalloprotease with PDZ domain
VPPYRLFIKVVDAPPLGGGSTGTHSFLMSMTETATTSEPRSTFFHEMTHQWVGDMSGRATSWFVEGFTVYTTATLPFKSDLVGEDSYIKEVNSEAKRYYTAKGTGLSMARITAVGFADEDVRYTAYTRGAMYFASVDAQIRRRSGGKRSLDSLILPLFFARQKGAPFTQATWEAAIGKELGPRAVDAFRAEVIDGRKSIVPASNAFGPCFRRFTESMISEANGRKVIGYQWKRIPGVAAKRCREF